MRILYSYSTNAVAKLNQSNNNNSSSGAAIHNEIELKVALIYIIIIRCNA